MQLEDEDFLKVRKTNIDSEYSSYVTVQTLGRVLFRGLIYKSNYLGTSADREIQRTLMELLNQMDGFDILGKVKMIMATNRPDTLDPALLRPGRLDRKIEIPLPNDQAR